jgi:hypothetical protein
MVSLKLTCFTEHRGASTSRRLKLAASSFVWVVCAETVCVKCTNVAVYPTTSSPILPAAQVTACSPYQVGDGFFCNRCGTRIDFPRFADCPQFNGAPCGLAGACVSHDYTAICHCYPGHIGDACERCQPGLTMVAGRCMHLPQLRGPDTLLTDEPQDCATLASSKSGSAFPALQVQLSGVSALVTASVGGCAVDVLCGHRLTLCGSFAVPDCI